MSSKENDFSTLEEMENYFLRKTEAISDCLKYRPLEKGSVSRFSDLKVSLSEIQDLFAKIKEELIAGRKNLLRMQNLYERVENVGGRLEHMDSNFPSVLKQPVPLQEKKPSIPNSVPKENQPPCETKSKGITRMQYVTVQEFDSVPKYMKGRLKYEFVNKFIDDFNSTIEKKYHLLKIPRKELKKPQLITVQKLKNQECPDTKGLYFCTSEDLKEYGNIKIDKTISNIITILRHCLKLKEIRSPGIIRYVIPA